MLGNSLANPADPLWAFGMDFETTDVSNQSRQTSPRDPDFSGHLHM